MRRLPRTALHTLTDSRGSGWSRHEAVELDDEVAGASQDRVGPVLRGVGDEPGVLQPARELGQRDLRLLPGEWGAEALVESAPEAEVLVVPACGIEAVGVAEALGIAASGRQHEHDR